MVRSPLRFFVGAALVALTLVSLPTTPALAAANQGGPQADCLNSGGSRDPVSRTCGRKTCNVVGAAFWVRGGTTFVLDDGKAYVCNGLTGKWM